VLREFSLAFIAVISGTRFNVAKLLKFVYQCSGEVLASPLLT
jgi:hypothetical protein